MMFVLGVGDVCGVRCSGRVVSEAAPHQHCGETSIESTAMRVAREDPIVKHGVPG
jgi:hypothetical protein